MPPCHVFSKPSHSPSVLSTLRLWGIPAHAAQSFGSCKLRFPTTPLKCTRTHRTPSAAPEARPSAPGLKERPHTPPHNANRNARREAGRGKRGRDSPFCSLSLESCNLLLRLDSARVPVLWPARADVSRRRPRRSIWLTGARAHSRRALGKRRVRGSAQPGEGCAAVEAPGRLWQRRIAG